MGNDEGHVSGDIDGFKYRVFDLNPLDATDVLADLGQIFAPVLGSLGARLLQSKNPNAIQDMLKSSTPDVETSSDAFGESINSAVLGFFERATKAKQRELIGIMVKKTMIIVGPGEEPPLGPVFTEHFRGRPKALYQWFFFAMKSQFEDFFSGNLENIRRSVARAVVAA